MNSYVVVEMNFKGNTLDDPFVICCIPVSVHYTYNIQNEREYGLRLKDHKHFIRDFGCVEFMATS
jgi:hypothetical protein